MSAASPVLSDLIEQPDIALPLERLRAGDVFVELRHDNVATRAIALDALLGRVADSDTKLVWIGNPLRSPLNLDRFFIQAAGPHADLRAERTPAELLAMLQAAVEGAPHCLFIVQQPETLDPEARDTLASLAPLLIRATPPMQFLFCGPTAFRPIAPTPPLESRLPALAGVAYEIVPPTSTGRGRKLPLLLLGFLLVSTIVVTSINEPSSERAAPAMSEAAAAAAEPAVAPAASIPTSPPPQAAPAPQPVQPDPVANPTIDVAALRREFDAFLAHEPRAIHLTQQQRDTLFDEFLARQQKRTQPKT